MSKPSPSKSLLRELDDNQQEIAHYAKMHGMEMVTAYQTGDTSFNCLINASPSSMTGYCDTIFMSLPTNYREALLNKWLSHPDVVAVPHDGYESDGVRGGLFGSETSSIIAIAAITGAVIGALATTAALAIGGGLC